MFEFEKKTVTRAFLEDLDTSFADKFTKEAFNSQSEIDQSTETLKGLPDSFISTLAESNMPETDFPSVITNTTGFDCGFRNMDERQTALYEQLGSLNLYARLLGHTRAITHMKIVGDDILITASDDLNIKVWHLPSLTLVQTFKGHTETITGIEVSPCGKYLVSYSLDESIRLWSLLTGECLALLTNEQPTDIQFSPCGRYMAISYDASVILYSLDGAPAHMVYQPISLVINQSTFENPMKTLKFRSSVSSIDFSAGGEFLAVSLDNGHIVMYTMCTLYGADIKASSKTVDYVLFSKSAESRMVSLDSKSGEIKVWKLSQKPESISVYSTKVGQKRALPNSIEISCDGTIVYAVTTSSLFAWSITSANTLINEDIPNPILDLDPHPIIPQVLLVVTKSFLYVIDIISDKRISLPIPVETPRFSKAIWTPDGRGILAADVSGGFYVFKEIPEPVCNMFEFFFPQDFTVSEWIQGEGQVEENGVQCHKNPRNVLVNISMEKIKEDYDPYNLCDIYTPKYPSEMQMFNWIFERSILHK